MLPWLKIEKDETKNSCTVLHTRENHIITSENILQQVFEGKTAQIFVA